MSGKMDVAILNGEVDEENALLSILRKEQELSMKQMEERLLHQLCYREDQNHKTESNTIIATTTESLSMPDAVHDGQFFTMVEDIYSMMCVSPTRSQSFVYATAIFLIKIFFYSVILASILLQGFIFPKDVEALVKVTQFFMLPVTVIVTDSGVLTALFVNAHLKWSPEIEEQNHVVTKRRYLYGNIARSIDALFYQVVIFFVLLQAKDVLSVFLNFAALRFFMEIHGVAFEVAKDGYLTLRLREAAANVQRIKIKATNCNSAQKIARIFFAVSLIGMYAAWFHIAVTGV